MSTKPVEAVAPETAAKRWGFTMEELATVPTVYRDDLFAGKTVLVTGGGGDFGRALTFLFARLGANVMICGRNVDKLEATAAGVRRLLGRDVVGIRAMSIRDPEMCEALIAETWDRYGALDLLVNNAGGQFSAPAEEITPKGWRAVHRLALDAAWDLTSMVATRSLIPRRGGLVVLMGFSPRRGIPGYAHAAAARGALESLAGSLAADWSRYGVRAVCVAAGNIATEGLEGYGPEEVERSRRQVPLGRLGRPEEVGELIAFLASPGGAYITGTTVVVDGGLDAWGQGEPPPEPEPAGQ